MVVWGSLPQKNWGKAECMQWANIFINKMASAGVVLMEEVKYSRQHAFVRPPEQSCASGRERKGKKRKGNIGFISGTICCLLPLRNGLCQLSIWNNRRVSAVRSMNKVMSTDRRNRSSINCTRRRPALVCTLLRPCSHHTTRPLGNDWQRAIPTYLVRRC